MAKKTDEPTTAVAKTEETSMPAVRDSQFLVCREDIGKIQEIMRVNLGGEEMSAFDLGRIRVPAGGTKFWTLPSPDGESSEKELKGIIVHRVRLRAYWSEVEPTGKPPDCRSNDNRRGAGTRWESDDPTEVHECESCKWKQWGSDKRGGAGQACKEMEACFVLRDESAFPDVLMLPPTSLNAMKGYLIRLGGRFLRYYEVVTTFALEEDRNDAGQTFNRVKPAQASKLTEQEVKSLATYVKEFTALIRAQSIAVAPEDSGSA